MGLSRFALFPQFALMPVPVECIPTGGTQPDGMTGSPAGTVRHMVG